VNIDFSAHPGFSIYVILLLLSGALMAVMGISGVTRQRTGWRIFNVLLGVGFFGYGFYLAFLFHGGSYIVFFKVFVVPVLLIARSFRSMGSRKSAPMPSQATPQPPASGRL
jgi:hypothetical protein